MTGEAVQTKKTRSITGKLYRAYLFKRIRIYLAEDILISLLLTVGAFVQQEYILTGSLARDRIRYLSLNPDRKTAMELPWPARLEIRSRSGTGVRPAMRVRMSVWLTPGRVYSSFRLAAAAQKLETPGVTS